MKSVLTVFLSCAILASAASAQNAPAPAPVGDGVWNMLPDKSDFGPIGAPGNMTLKVKSNGPVFEVDQESSEGAVHLVFRSDGKEVVNAIPGGEMKSRHWMEGDVMRDEISVGDLTFKDRVTYSPDGRIMTMDRELTTPDGPRNIKIVFERAAPARPSMAGSWKLDTAKSDFGGPMPAKYSATITVEGHAFSMRQSTDQGDFEIKLRDDGQETTNEIGGMTMKSKMWWDQDALAGEHVYKGNGVEMSFKDRTTFSPDGKVMTIERVGQMPGGERKTRIVMVRQ